MDESTIDSVLRRTGTVMNPDGTPALAIRQTQEDVADEEQQARRAEERRLEGQSIRRDLVITLNELTTAQNIVARRYDDVLRQYNRMSVWNRTSRRELSNALSNMASYIGHLEEEIREVEEQVGVMDDMTA